MAKTKLPLTFSERARRFADAAALRYDPLRELHDDLEELKGFAETFVENDPNESIEGLTEAAEALTNLEGLGVVATAQQVAAIEEAISGLGELPSVDDVSALVDAIERLGEVLDELQMHRDDPSAYDREEQAATRDEVREALNEVADALETTDSLTPENAVV